MPARLAAVSIRDPRLLQIAFLGSVLCAGLTVLHFDLQLWQPLLIVATALGMQWGMTRLMKVPSAGVVPAPLRSFLPSLVLCRARPGGHPLARAAARRRLVR